MEQTTEQKIQDLGQSVLKMYRNTLVLNLRFMDTAVSRLDWVPVAAEQKQAAAVPENLKLATDGEHLYYDPLEICKMCAAGKKAGARAYLHLVLHCVLRHFTAPPAAQAELWDLACDLAVESAINEMDIPSVQTEVAEAQAEAVERIQKDVKLLTAEKLYHWLEAAELSPAELEELKAAFRQDDHAVWYASPEERRKLKGQKPSDAKKEQKQEPPAQEQEEFVREESADKAEQNARAQLKKQSQEESEDSEDKAKQESPSGQNDLSSGAQELTSEAEARAALEQSWKDVSEKLQLDMETFQKNRQHNNSRLGGAGTLIQNLQEVNRERYDYTDFLRKFAVTGEVMRLNPDEFDYVFYTYGMTLYPEQRMPLVEPLEYREEKRIREFVLAIDTSGSVEGELVQKFVQKTYNILKSTDSFFSKTNLHIIQSDAAVQEDVKITSQKEFDEYFSRMQLKGFGGNNEKKLFAYVEQLQKEEFRNLKGMIYVTDGYGIFPSKKPNFDVAFVFLENDRYPIPTNLPPWVIKLVLKPEELEKDTVSYEY